MMGRGDVARYQNGADTIENGVVVVQGGVMRRSGLRYLATAKLGGASAVRLVRYVYNVEQSFALEFGNLYVRVFEASIGAVVLNAALTPLEIVSPYTAAQLPDVTTRQVADVMYLFHKDVAPQELRRLSATLWTLLPSRFVAEPFAEIGHLGGAKLTIDNPAIGAGRTFTTANATVPGAPTGATATPFNGSARVTVTAPVDNGGATIDSYTATSSPGGLTGTASGTTITVPGLTNGVAYTFTVTAHNSAGNGAASAATAAVTPLSSLGGGTITATASPMSSTAAAFNGLDIVDGPTASGSGGTGPYSYLWSKLSGSADISTGSTSALLSVDSEAYSATNYASWRCVVTDSLGATGSVDVTFNVRHNVKGL
ncbi:MAG: fibronectin type III domain-containing protein [Pseudomonadota bacterium]|nr:fibronectin type III domain-containing protein [Pseudomonadota bacterium]